MKKLLTALLIGCFAFSVVAVSGCSKDKKDEKKDEKKDDKKKDS